jgi:hypothetical protein
MAARHKEWTPRADIKMGLDALSGEAQRRVEQGAVDVRGGTQRFTQGGSGHLAVADGILIDYISNCLDSGEKNGFTEPPFFKQPTEVRRLRNALQARAPYVVYNNLFEVARGVVGVRNAIIHPDTPHAKPLLESAVNTYAREVVDVYVDSYNQRLYDRSNRHRR